MILLSQNIHRLKLDFFKISIILKQEWQGKSAGGERLLPDRFFVETQHTNRGHCNERSIK